MLGGRKEKGDDATEKKTYCEAIATIGPHGVAEVIELGVRHPELLHILSELYKRIPNETMKEIGTVLVHVAPKFQT